MLLLVAFGCARSAHQTALDALETIIPSDVMGQVDHSVSFTELRSAPDNFTGRTVMFGGVALKSRRVKDHTEIEIMQLPMGTNMVPSDRRTKSEGRFLARQSGEFLDPAIIEPGSLLTVVGEVKGTASKPLDEGDYLYPVIEIKHFVDWNEVESRRNDRSYAAGPWYYGPRSSLYYGYGAPFRGPSFWGPYGAYPYYYGGPYYAFPFSFSSPAPPSAPPPSSVPPQFQNGR